MAVSLSALTTSSVLSRYRFMYTVLNVQALYGLDPSYLVSVQVPD